MSPIAANIARMYLGWCPLLNKGEICAIPDKEEGNEPSSQPSGISGLRRMDYYRNQVLVMNIFTTFVLLSALWFFFFYRGAAEELSGERFKGLLMFGWIFGLGYSIYQVSCYRKKLFKGEKLTLGYRYSKSYKIAIIYYFITFVAIYSILMYFFGSIGFLLAIFSFGFSYLAVQWFWYLDIIRYERKYSKKFIWRQREDIFRGVDIKSFPED